MRFLVLLVLVLHASLSSAQETRGVLTGRSSPGCALQILGLLDFGAVVAGKAQVRSLGFRNASSTHSCEIYSAQLVQPSATPADPFPASQFMLETLVTLPLTLPPLAEKAGAISITYTPSALDPGAPPDASTADRAELVVKWRTP